MLGYVFGLLREIITMKRLDRERDGGKFEGRRCRVNDHMLQRLMYIVSTYGELKSLV